MKLSYILTGLVARSRRPSRSHQLHRGVAMLAKYGKVFQTRPK